MVDKKQKNKCWMFLVSVVCFVGFVATTAIASTFVYVAAVYEEPKIIEEPKESTNLEENEENIELPEIRLAENIPVEFSEIFQYLVDKEGIVLTIEVVQLNDEDVYRAKIATEYDTATIIFLDKQTGMEIYRVDDIPLTAEELSLLESPQQANEIFVESQNISNSQSGQFVVIIDAGHGGTAPGAVQSGTRESDLNLAVAQKLFALIENNPNITAYLTRDSDTNIGLRERSAFGNTYGTIFISIHHNATNNRNVNGIETFFTTTDFDENRQFTSRQFADIMQRNLINQLNSHNRGVRNRRFGVLRRSQIPAVLVELGFMTNQTELSRIRTQEFQQQAAQALYNGILETFDNFYN
ncbi:MAG: N-acetylmuramoyl-L-alanine amidase [Firmicutes bacterium]|nr:N-acetylmuramoyl-L-alanine amidase [Bacillota bacterium]